MYKRGNVFYYGSTCLNERSDGKTQSRHYHVYLYGDWSGDSNFLSIITDRNSGYVKDFRERNGDDVVADIDKDEYGELTKDSSVCGEMYFQQKNELNKNDKKPDIDKEVLIRIYNAILHNKEYKQREKKTIEDARDELLNS